MFENNLKTAAIYARVSTTRQAEEGFSLPSQIDACVRKAKELGISNIIKYVDNASGTTLDRPALTIMRKAIREKKIDIIINQAGIIIENTKENKAYVFDMNVVNKFIKISVDYILSNLKDIKLV